MSVAIDVKANPIAAPGSASIHGGGSTALAPAKPTTASGVVFSNTPGMPGVFKSNFDYQLVRAMGAGAYGDGGAVGEVYATARQVVDGDIESWTVAWTETAERVERIAHDCLSGGHVVSAREAFLRASCYWGTGCFYLEGNDQRHLKMYKSHRSCFGRAAQLFDRQIEPVSIPYENGKTLPGYFMRADDRSAIRPSQLSGERRPQEPLDIIRAHRALREALQGCA